VGEGIERPRSKAEESEDSPEGFLDWEGVYKLSGTVQQLKCGADNEQPKTKVSHQLPIGRKLIQRLNQKLPIP
jgi:hypothetical protein